MQSGCLSGPRSCCNSFRHDLRKRSGSPSWVLCLDPPALLGEEIQKQFLAAADVVNARRSIADGRQIEIVTFDNLGNPQDSLIALKRVIDQGISFVTMGRSNIALAVSDALQKHNERNPDQRVLLLVYEAGDPVLTESKCNFWTFRFNSHADMNVNVLTDHMARQTDVRKVYLINQDFAAGQSVSRCCGAAHATHVVARLCV